MSLQFRFSREMHRARKERGLTQESAAEALGISLRWYQSIEEGYRLPATLLTLKIIAFFEIEGGKLRTNENVSLSSG